MLASSSSPSNAFTARQHHPYAAPRHNSNYHSSSSSLSKRSISSSPRHSANFSSSSTLKVLEQPSPSTSCLPYADAGTQYSPPDWPPTSSRSSLRLRQAPVAPEAPEKRPSGQASTPRTPGSPSLDAKATPQPPPEPRLRVTPQSSFQNNRKHGRGDASSSSNISDGLLPTTEPLVPVKKKKRADGNLVKVLPADYTKCDTAHLSILMSDLLMDMIRHNDEIPLNDGHLTRFHSRSPPGISVQDYVNRLIFHATLSCPVLLSTICYIDRLCAAYPAFNMNSLTVHRFLIAAATVAAKGLCDVFWTNSTYAKVGGVSVKELHLLELELLTRMDWKIIPDPDRLVEYYRSLIARSDDFELETGPKLSEDPRDLMDTDSDASGDEEDISD